jgi:hypothetical protein
VSEDFDMALRLQTSGYILRLAAYAGQGFKEGVSLTVYDELARWEKYAYGCSELIFHPVKYWFVRGPFTVCILEINYERLLIMIRSRFFAASLAATCLFPVSSRSWPTSGPTTPSAVPGS